MSSLVETSSKEDSSPVPGVHQPIAGHNFKTHSLSKRTWNGHDLTTYSHCKGESESSNNNNKNDKDSRDKDNNSNVLVTTTPHRNNNQDTITPNREELRQELISMLTSGEDTPEDQDTIAKIDGLIALMKTQKLSDDDHLPSHPPLPTSSTISNTTINNAATTSSPCSSSSSSSSSSSFDFNFDNKPGYAPDGMVQLPLANGNISATSSLLGNTSTTAATTSMPTMMDENTFIAVPLSDFHFSFASTSTSSSPSSTRSRSHSRRHNRNGAKRSSENPALYNSSILPHPLSQATYPAASSRGGDHDDDDDDDYESDIDIIEAQILRASSPSQHAHILNRKILPLPKPRWLRKAGVLKQQQSSSSESVAEQQTETSSSIPAHPVTKQKPSSSSSSSSSPLSSLVSYMWPFSTPILESSASPSSLASQPQRNYAPAYPSTGENNNNHNLNFGSTGLKDILLEHEIHNVGDPVDASYRDNTKKIKRCGDDDNDEGITCHNNDSDEQQQQWKGILRRKDRRWKNSGADDRKGKSAPSPLSSPAAISSSSSSLLTQPSSSSGVQFPASSFDFTMDLKKEKLKQLPKLDNFSQPSSSPSMEPTLGLSDVLRRTLSQKVDRMETFTPNRSRLANNKSSLPTQPPPPKLPPTVTRKNTKNNSTSTTLLSATSSNTATGKKKSKENRTAAQNDKPTTTKSKSSSSKRGKKSQRKKKAEDEHHGSGANNNNNKMYNNSSDVAVVRSSDPDEWICVFCQYEIFSNGLEAARRKGGYYRRRRERQRRLREMEARRTGECISGPTSDVDDSVDDPPLPPLSQQQHQQQQQYIEPPAVPGIGGSVGTGPPPGLGDHRRRGRESRAA